MIHHGQPYPFVLVPALCLVEFVDMKDSMASVAFQIRHRLPCALRAFGKLNIVGRSTSRQFVAATFLVFSELLLGEVERGLSLVTAVTLDFPTNVNLRHLSKVR
jgi:hypothetical protein